MGARPEPVDLTTPFTTDRLLEVRTSKMKHFPGVDFHSGIDKKLLHGQIKIDKLGLEGDEHDLTFHGGPDKAILGYCSSHYPSWGQEYPERRDRFVPGGFGENFVTARMNERNVCIGDIISVGPEVLLQVSLPRMPCFKLNHRFSLKQFAPVTYKTSRTGWYYRVLREGTVQAGDELALVERKWPKWTVERVQEYLHRDTDNFKMNQELSRVESLGMESRGQFQNRVAKAKRKAEMAELAANHADSWRDFEIVSRNQETPSIVSLVLRAKEDDRDTDLDVEGLHARIKLPTGLIRSYSVVSAGQVEGDDNPVNHFELGIKLAESSRGGSEWFHKAAAVGDVVQVAKLTSDYSLSKAASCHVFIVGGIGITAYLALLKTLREINYTYKVHYAVRSMEEVPFRQRLEQHGSHVVYYDGSRGQRMDVGKIVATVPWNSHLYACGPPRMMDETKAAVGKSTSLLPSEVHYEAFSADATGDPFEVEVRNRGGVGGGAKKVVKVGGEESLLEVLRREFDEVPSSCEVGNCGTCKVVLAEGRVEHRGVALSEEEQGSAMLSCVSRGLGRIAIEI